MKAKYICPFCRGVLNTEGKIILSAKTARGKTGLVLLHEEIDNYSVEMSDSLDVTERDIVDFYCPVCHSSLNTEKGEHYARFLKVDSEEVETKIIISREYGDKRSFEIRGEKLESYGESVRKFMDPEWFLD